MQAGGALFKEFPALLCAEFNAGLKGFYWIIGNRFKDVVHVLRDACTTGGAEAHQSIVVGDG